MARKKTQSPAQACQAHRPAVLSPGSLSRLLCKPPPQNAVTCCSARKLHRRPLPFSGLREVGVPTEGWSFLTDAALRPYWGPDKGPLNHPLSQHNHVLIQFGRSLKANGLCDEYDVSRERAGPFHCRNADAGDFKMRALGTPLTVYLTLCSIFFCAGAGAMDKSSNDVDLSKRPGAAKGQLLKPGAKVVFFGDSITRNGVKPGGYIRLMSETLEQTYPDRPVKLIGAGKSGNKVTDLQGRLQRDVLKQNPDLVVIYIGINDAWHWTRPHPRTGAKRDGTTAEKYEAALRNIIQQIQAQNAKVVLCTPSVIGEELELANPNNQRLDAFAAICRKVASEMGCSLVDLRKAFITYLKENNPTRATKGILTRDTVHLNDKGNQFVAQQIVKGLTTDDRKEANLPRQNLHIYLLIGQSNMAGRAPFTDEEGGPVERCYLLDGEGQWEPAQNPLNRHSTIRKDLSMQKLGPGYSFAKTMLNKNKDISIGLVVNAKGGSKIEEWGKGTPFYKDALRRVKVAQKSGALRGILWHQGESNSKNPTGYLEKLKALIADLRNDLGMADLPFIAGQINNIPAINDQIAKLPEVLPFTGFASSKGLKAKDRWHFDSTSVKLLGMRYANEMQKVQLKLH